MEYKVEFTITLPEELLKTLGVSEDTILESYFNDGKIKVRILDEDNLGDEFEDGSEDFEDDVPEKCADCSHYCWRCDVCTLEE